MKNLVILKTPKGGKYGRMIGRSFYTLAEKHGQRSSVHLLLPQELDAVYRLNPDDTIIHPRTAHPTAEWSYTLDELQSRGYKVHNSGECVRTTSDKGRCAEILIKAGIAHPASITVSKRDVDTVFSTFSAGQTLVIKPTTSLSQGQHVQKIVLGKKDDFLTAMELVPGSNKVVQEFVDYTGIHRIVVIDNRALPYSFVDRVSFHPNEWKVSVCLSTTKRLSATPDTSLLKMAELSQKAVGGTINFIDIFETREGYSMSEINTACSLIGHERLAKQGGVHPWNIHLMIAKSLYRKII